MAFNLLREIADVQRDNGKKRILIALYEAEAGGNRYLAASEQVSNESGTWLSSRKGITFRKSELSTVIKALQEVESYWDSDGPDPKTIPDAEYAARFIT